MKSTKTFNKAIKTWFLEKEINIRPLEFYDFRDYKEGFKNVTILKETEKAILVDCPKLYDKYWIPKSVIIEEWEEPNKKMINLSYHTYLYSIVEDLCTYETILKKSGLHFFIDELSKLNPRDYLYTVKNKDLENCLKEDKITYLKKMIL